MLKKVKLELAVKKNEMKIKTTFFYKIKTTDVLVKLNLNWNNQTNWKLK